MDEAEKRKAARKRRANVTARALKRAGPEPTQKEPSMRVFPNPVVVPGTDPQTLHPVLIPDPVQRDSEGRRPLREIIRRIQASAGVTALLAHDQLMAQEGDIDRRSEWATEIVARHASLTPGYLSQRGREELARLRLEGEDFDRLVAILFVGPEHGLTKDPVKLAAAYLEALGLLTTTLTRVMRIVAEADDAFDTRDDKEAGNLVIEAYGHGQVAISRCDLVRIAALVDINPAPIWIQYAHLAPVLEIARFGGKLVKASRCGGQVWLDRRLFPVLRQVLGQAGSSHAEVGTEAAYLLIEQLVGARFDLPELLRRLEWHDDFEIDLLVGEPCA